MANRTCYNGHRLVCHRHHLHVDGFFHNLDHKGHLAFFQAVLDFVLRRFFVALIQNLDATLMKMDYCFYA